MRIIVVADTHGNVKSVVDYMESVEKFDLAVHLGDYTADGKTIAALTGIKTIMVRGNGDYSDEKNPDEEVLELYGKKIFLTHGHLYGVKRDLGNLFYKAKELEADIVLFGHSHISVSLEHENIVLFNPGSASEPRLGVRPSVGIIEIDEHVLEKNIINL